MPITLKYLKPKDTDFEPKTVGQHVRHQRLELGLTQKQVADQLGVNPWTVLNWEKGHTEPPVEAVPTIIRFLGYDPFPEPGSLPERLLAKRRLMGWSIKKAARQLGVDEGTWGDWERGRVILRKAHRTMIAQFIGVPAAVLTKVMKAQWNHLHPKRIKPGL